MRIVRLTLEYDGTAYYGWQVQAGHKTVQGELERAIKEITGRDVTLFGAGRTDAGVHALSQVANFKTSCRIPMAKWPHALNAHLPEDIRVVGAADVSPDFHSQVHAKEKTYRYAILNRDTASALRRTRVHLIRRTLDVDRMNEAAKLLIGTHDFRAFGSEMSKKERTTRTISAASVRRVDDEIWFDFTGDGFLYNQVRAMVGTLVEVGLGKRPPGWVREVLESRDRTKAGANVPAKGLCLVEVRYDGLPR
jgi:tRNA pseudouridine38-40 synthase